MGSKHKRTAWPDMGAALFVILGILAVPLCAIMLRGPDVVKLVGPLAN